MSALLAGLVEGFAEGRNKKIEKEQNEELKKFQIKLFKKQLDEADFRSEAKQRLMDLMSGAGSPVPFNDEQGAVFADVPGFQAQPEGLSAPGKKMNLAEVLADPQGQLAALQSGMFKPEDLRKQTNPGLEVLKALGIGKPASGAIGAPQSGPAGGMQLSGLKIGGQGEVMPDFARPKLKMEVPSADGMSMIQIDEFGRQMGIRPIGPGEKKPTEQTKGQNAADAEFAKEYVDLNAAGGFAQIQKGIAQLKEVYSALEKGGITGPVIGSMPDAALKFINPESLAMRDQAHEVIQANLRMVLGPAFTQKEGEGVMARAYDQSQDDAVNKQRIGRLIKQISEAAAAKMDASRYFEKHGTLTGWKGKLWSADDFLKDVKGGGTSVVDFNDLPK